MSGKKHKKRLDKKQIKGAVSRALREQPVIDMHTHLYPPSFGTPVAGKGGDIDEGGLMLWGVDELLTYHYLIAELFRTVRPSELTPDAFYGMDKRAQAELIWKNLFIDRSPISEAARGVLTTLQKLGLDTGDRDLEGYRKWFGEQTADGYIDKVMEIANVSSITMTNAVFDDNERERWLADGSIGDDSRFTAVLRLDPLICNYREAAGKLREWGYEAGDVFEGEGIEEVKRFLRDWIGRIKAIYAAVSLPPDFRYEEGGEGTWGEGSRVLREAILPVCREFDIPFAMMIGSQRGVNPPLRDAGDMGFKADVESVARICREFSENRFFVTLLSRENQHELAVAARKFGNLMVFGCWWFLNNPSIIEEMTRMRCELLGTTFIPQHSDARVLDQLIYKWDHSRGILYEVFKDKYLDLAATGWSVTEKEIRRDVEAMLSGNFRGFLKG